MAGAEVNDVAGWEYVYCGGTIGEEGTGDEATVVAPELSQDMEPLEGDVRDTGGGGGRVPEGDTRVGAGRGGRERTPPGMTAGGGGGRGRLPGPFVLGCSKRVGLCRSVNQENKSKNEKQKRIPSYRNRII